MPSPVSTLPEVLTEVLPIRPLFAPTCAAELRANYLRSKRYSSITTPTPRRPPSSKLRTTRPRQSTCTAACAPTTSAGSDRVKSTDEPTGTSTSLRNRTPLAEILSVSTVFAATAHPAAPDWPPVDFKATGSFMGKRGAACTSVYPRRFLLTSATIPLAVSDTFATTLLPVRTLHNSD